MLLNLKVAALPLPVQLLEMGFCRSQCKALFWFSDSPIFSFWVFIFEGVQVTHIIGLKRQKLEGNMLLVLLIPFNFSRMGLNCEWSSSATGCFLLGDCWMGKQKGRSENISMGSSWQIPPLFSWSPYALRSCNDMSSCIPGIHRKPPTSSASCHSEMF